MIGNYLRAASLATIGLVGTAVTAYAASNAEKEAPVPVVTNVDLQRYMGPWFIVGAIGLGLEDGAHNAVETYTMKPDGTIDTVFQFRKDGFNGELETKNTTAWVQEGTNNAEWKVRTLWPLKQQYLISHLEPDYSAAIIAREKRDYVWILARSPKMSDTQFNAYRAKIEAMGYDMTKFSRYPHDGRMPDPAKSSS
ncbi:MAG: lipocalin family protein [Panacagrimonas sp.]